MNKSQFSIFSDNLTDLLTRNFIAKNFSCIKIEPRQNQAELTEQTSDEHYAHR